jgi:TolB-like protein/Flp pilus assembly protein TadD
MLAVLPFENLGSPDQEYFADGITDEITGKLAAIRDLGVISRTSTMPYKRSTKGLREIAKELGVDYVLEGTILWDRGGDTSRVRILPQLIRVSDDTHLWAETYQRPLIDIFAVQAEIATQIAAAMNITLRGPEVAALNDMPTKNLEAYQAYLRGIDYFNAPDMTFANGQLAVQMFERAARLDTTFVQAYAYLGMAHAQMYGYGHDASEGRLTQAKLATDRALALQPGSSRAHQALSTYYYWGFKDYERTLRELEYAEVGILNDAWIIDRKAFIHARQGRSKMALEEMRRAFALSPRDAGLARDLAYLYTLSRDYELAERFCDQSIALAPDQTLAYARKAGNYYAWRGDTAAARATLAAIPDQQADDTRWRWVVHHIFTRDYSAVLASLDSMRPSADLWTVSGYVHKLLNAPEQSRMCFDSARVNGEKELAERPNNPNTHGGLGFIYACLGHKDEAIREGMRGVDLLPVSKDAVDGPAGVETLVEIYIEVGEYDAALDQIEYLLSIPCGVSVSLLRLDPLYDPLRKLPRFQKLLEQPDKVF